MLMKLTAGGEKTSTRDYAFRRADGTQMIVPVRMSACSRIEVSNVTKKVRSIGTWTPKQKQWGAFYLLIANFFAT